MDIMDFDDLRDEVEKFREFFSKRTSCPSTMKILVPKRQYKFLLVEDGSIDTSILDKYNVPYVVYRQGSTPPKVIDMTPKD